MSETLSLDENRVQRLPLPLAQLARRAHNAHSPLERHHTAYYLWESSLKLMASVAIVEYAELGDHDPALTEKLKNLARPALGHWWEFVRRLVPVLAERGDVGFTGVRDLVLGRARDDLPRAAGLDAVLLETLEGRRGARSTVRLTELFERLVQYRNRELGHGAAGQRQSDFYDRMSRALLAAAAEVFDRVDVLAGRSLIFVGEVRRQASGDWLVERYALSGETPKRLESLELAEATALRLPRPERVYLEGVAPPSGAMAPRLNALHPLVHFDSSRSVFSFLNARRGKRDVEYLCYLSGETFRREELGVEHRDLLARVLGSPVAADAADGWAAASLADEPATTETISDGASRQIGEFELLSRLGQGGMGVVYRAWQPSLGRQVALKCLLRAGDPKGETRFSREVRALGRVEHPNIVKVFTSGAEADRWFYAMELIEGAELSRVCEQLAGASVAEIDDVRWQRALTTACEQARSQETQLSSSRVELVRPASTSVKASSPRIHRDSPPVVGRGHVNQVVGIMRVVAQAAHALHDVGVVHRDIKPGNIMLSADGNHPVLMDLGLAQLADESDGRVTRTRQFVGTLRYASPEQILAAGQVDRRTDVYSIGATLWELLTLRPIFGADDSTPTPELMLKIQTTDVGSPRKFNSHVPPDLEAIVLKCLEKDRTQRYGTAADLAEDLDRFAHGEPVLAQPPSLTYVVGKFVRRHKAPLATAAALFLGAVAIVVAAFIQITKERNDALDAKKSAVDAQQAAVKAEQKAKDERETAVKLNEQLASQLYATYIAVAERELTMNHDVSKAAALLSSCPEHLRGWEWNYLIRRLDGGRAPLTGHKAGLWMADFNHDGTRVATASIDGTVKIWDAASGTLQEDIDAQPDPILPANMQLLTPALLRSQLHGVMSTFGIPKIPIMCVAFSPDGQRVASGSFAPKVVQRGFSFDVDLRGSPGVVTLWDVKTGAQPTKLLDFQEQLGVVLSLAFSPDGSRIASSSIDPEHTFVVWEAVSGAVIKKVHGHASHIHRLRYSADGRLLASVDTDGKVKFWDATTLEHVRTIDAHLAPIIDGVFTPDGQRFATASEDGTVRIWNTATGERIRMLTGHTGSALGVAFGPDGKLLASAGLDRTVRLWDSETGNERITLRGHTEMVWSVAFSRDGNQLVSAGYDNTARIWDSTPRSESPTNGVFTITAQDDHDHRVNRVAFSPDGRYLATSSWDNTVQLLDGNTGASVRPLVGHVGAVWGIDFSSDGKRLVSAGWDRQVKIWDTATGDAQLTMLGHTAPVHAVAYSPDGQSVVSCGFDGQVKVWDAATGTLRTNCDGFIFPVFDVDFSPDGKRIASAGADRAITIWEANSGRKLLMLKGHNAAVPKIAFSPDGKRLVSAGWDRTIRVWDVDPDSKAGSDNRNLLTITDPDAAKGYINTYFNAVTFSPDGTRIASGGEDKALRIWDARTGVQLLPSLVHRGVLWGVAFSPDGKRIASGSWYTSAPVRTWSLENIAQ
ncbi:MAG TPA: protein kinase [Pirellulales bacterium]|nr:protein kinase [Pirellulales bacterium]